MGCERLRVLVFVWLLRLYDFFLCIPAVSFFSFLDGPLRGDSLCSSGTCLDVHDAGMYMLIPGLSIMHNTLVDLSSLRLRRTSAQLLLSSIKFDVQMYDFRLTVQRVSGHPKQRNY